MNPAAALATAGRVLDQLRHDPRTVAMLLLLPAMLLGLFAWVMVDTPVFQTVGPAILALFPFIVMFLVTSITTLRERRSGSMERLFTMPLGRLDFILGYAIAFAAVAVVQAVVTVTMAVVVCGLDVDGAIWELGLVAVLDAILGSSLGLFTSAFARTEFQAVQFMPLVVFPQLLIGGILLPREQMPDVLQVISDWLPLSHAVDAVTAVTAGESGWDVWRPLLIVVAFAVGAIVLGASTLRRRSGDAPAEACGSTEAIG